MTDQQVDQQTDLRTNKAGCSRVARDKKCCKSENTLIGNWVFSFKLATLSGALPNNAEKANGIRPASRPTNQHSGLLSCGVACDYKLRMFKNIHHRFLSCSFSGEYSSMTFDLFPPPTFDFLPWDSSCCIIKSLTFYDKAIKLCLKIK